MGYEEFVDRMLEVSPLDSRSRIEEIIAADLETLGERLYRTERYKLGSQLPNELKELLYKREKETTPRQGEHYELQEFYNRVGARAGIKYYDAAERSKEVMHVLQQAVSPGIIEAVLDELPSDYSDLFEIEDKGPGFPSL